MHLDDAVTQYLTEAHHQGRLRALTVEKYRYVLDIFVAFMTAKYPNVELADVRIGHLSEFITAVSSERSHSRTTTEHYVSTLRAFFNHFVFQDVLPGNPALRLHRPRRDEREPDALTEAELRCLFTADLTPPGSRFRPDFDYDRRNQLIVRVLGITAIRRAELCALNWGHLNLTVKPPTLKVVQGKGGKDRTVPLLPWLAGELAAYRADRHAGSRAPVFTSAAGRRLKPDAITCLFQRLVTPVLGRRVTPHLLRATCATLMTNNGANLLHVSKLLGHKHLDTTQRYVRTEIEQLAAAMQQHPLAELAWQSPLPGL